MKLESYTVFKPFKQHTIVGKDEDNEHYSTLIYLQRPKWIKDDEVWETICNSVRLELPLGFEIK